MKKAALGLLCLIALMSCEMPESLTVKGNPGLYIPLGSPFNKLDEKDRLENQISIAKIREMLSETGDDEDPIKLNIYEYSGPDVADQTVQAYLIHYPIVEMKFDLEAYINEAMENDQGEKDKYTIPAEFAALPQSVFPKELTRGNTGEPLFTIPLDDMSDLVKTISYDKIGLKMEYSDNSFAQNVEIKIPAFGINDYTKGTQTTEDGINKLLFVNETSGEFIPKSSTNSGSLNGKGEIEIYVQLSGPCSGTIAPEMVFEWTEATIDASSQDAKTGEFPIENPLGDFLGDGSKIKKVTGYFYVTVAEGFTAKVNITADGSDIIKPGASSAPYTLKSVNRPVFSSDLYQGPLPNDSLYDATGKNGIDLTPVFNASTKQTLEYKISIEEMTIKPTDKEKIITADLVILLPMEVEINESYDDNYVKLKLGDSFENISDGDLFGRNEDGDNFLDMLDSVKITIKDINNNILDISKLALLVETNKTQTLEFNNGKSLTFTADDIKTIPFNPKFTMLLERGGNSTAPGTLRILRPTGNTSRKFDFKIDVEAKAKVNYKIDF